MIVDWIHLGMNRDKRWVLMNLLIPRNIFTR
jgi:hypothetical protein